LNRDHQHTSCNTTDLSLLLESLGEAAHILREVALVAEELNVGTVDLDPALLALLNVLLAAEGSEAPVLGDDNLLATGELVLATPQSLESSGAVGIPRSDGHEDLTNVHASDKTVGLAESTAHTGLQPIGSSAR